MLLENYSNITRERDKVQEGVSNNITATTVNSVQRNNLYKIASQSKHLMK